MSYFIVRFNQKLLFILITTLVSFNLISLITEFSYYSTSLCFAKLPTKLISKALYESDPSYRDYSKHGQFLTYLGLILSFSISWYVILCAFNDVRNKEYKQIVRTRFLRPFVLKTLGFGTILTLQMPVYTYDWVIC